MIRVAVTGATGRMGRAVIETAGARDDVEVACAFNRDPQEESVDGVPLRPTAEIGSALAETDADVVVDFTGPSTALDAVEACVDADVPFVTGTTGFEDDELAVLEEASAEIPVLKASNFARGIQALLRTLSEAVATLPGYDIELTETHHNGKRDAPSGTALTLLDEIAEQRDFDTQYGREGFQPREEGEIGVHVRRAGNVRGEHEIMFADNDEVVTLTHRAEDRGVFAAGSLDAAVWILDQDAGYYDFGDVVDA
ncbi:4-hydroxy-tetrahydrodipicolinate reductase [Haloarculaceae archaeon H-GB2-1]|nr:4-hydroxy-tetrahydrodipicolinate reductase [Haloarculaceae archaeon H-GB1-1]MEA5387740.1 4-hydroxy-tetrahydrodipicolinate reductase [Haloarculaceae archaeon H-GB11]MEA5409232.1 4-hydroxy-tetrahydrodipicolinate reductase [Haloarculaceae archaeon H-GB2-1]